MSTGAAGINGRAACIRVLVWLALGAAIFHFGPYATLTNSGRTALLEESPAYTSSQLARQTDRLGVAGRAAYIRFQALDTLMAALTAWAALGMVRWSLGRGAPAAWARRWMPRAPWALFVAECLENALLALCTAMVASPPDWAMVLAPIASSIKFAALLGTLVTLVICLGRVAWCRWHVQVRP
ncbi:MAG: hypothetical protein JNK75_09170 [Betaproteobacteria bacterium]|nr:hypothetical protein [Betaproteobacteria bacterium]